MYRGRSGEGSFIEIKIVTNNRHKFLEAKHILENFGIKASQVKVKSLEIQDDRLERIAVFRLRYALKFADPPLATEDAGLFVESLSGFPGPYSSYVFRTIGCEGLLKLMEGEGNRRAKFVSVVAYVPADGKIRLFRGILKGELSDRMRGRGGFGFDPIFVPTGGHGKTLAELSSEEKNAISHRAKSFGKLAKFVLRHL